MKLTQYRQDVIGYACPRCGLRAPEPRPKRCVCGADIPRSQDDIERAAKPFPWEYVWGPLGLALALTVVATVVRMLGIW